MNYLIRLLGKRTLMLAAILCLCSGIWADDYYYTLDGTECLSKSYDESILNGKDYVLYRVSAEGVVSICTYTKNTTSTTGDISITIPDVLKYGNEEGIKVVELATRCFRNVDSQLKEIVFPKYLKKIASQVTTNYNDPQGKPGIDRLVTIDFTKVQDMSSIEIADNAFKGCSTLLGDDGRMVFAGTDPIKFSGKADRRNGITYTICPKSHAMSVTGFDKTKIEDVLRIAADCKFNNELSGECCEIGTYFKDLTKNPNNAQKTLNYIILGEGITSLPAGAFSGCTNLRLLTLPKSCDFGLLATDDDNSRCGADVLKGFNTNNSLIVLAFCGGVPYIIRNESSDKFTAYFDTPENKDKIYHRDVLSEGQYSRFGSASGKIALSGRIEFLKGFYANLYLNTVNGFKDNTAITEVTVGNAAETSTNTISTIGDDCFNGCTGIKNVTFYNEPDNTLGLGARCFKGCTGISELDFTPRYVSRIGEECFAGCKFLTTLSFGNTIPTSSIGDNIVESDQRLRVVNYAKEMGNARQPSDYLVHFTYYLPTASDETFTIGDGAAFKGMTSLCLKNDVSPSYLGSALFVKSIETKSTSPAGELIFPEDVYFKKEMTGTGIGSSGDHILPCDGCFNNKDISTISLPHLFRYSGDNCFDIADNVLKEVTFTYEDVEYRSNTAVAANGEVSITAYRLNDATKTDLSVNYGMNLSNLHFYVTNVDGLFCTTDGDVNTMLKSVTFNDIDFNTGFTRSDAVKKLTIGSQAFQNTAIESVVLPKRNVEFKSNAFSDCAKLKSVRFNCDKVKLGEYLFKNCTSLTSLVLPFIDSESSFWDISKNGLTNLKAIVLRLNYTATPDAKMYSYLCSCFKTLNPDGKIYAMSALYATLDAKTISGNGIIKAIDYRLMSHVNGYDPSHPVMTKGYGTVCLPQPIKMADCYNLKAVYKTELADGDNGSKVVRLVPQTAEQLLSADEAGQPYVYARNNNDTDDADADNLVVFVVDDNVESVTKAKDDPVLGGAPQAGVSPTVPKGSYILQSDNLFHRVSDSKDTTVRSYRAWLKPFATASAAARLSMIEDDMPTAIDGVTDNAGTAVTDTPVYNLAGQRISAPVKGQIYVVNGKKVLFQ